MNKKKKIGIAAAVVAGIILLIILGIVAVRQDKGVRLKPEKTTTAAGTNKTEKNTNKGSDKNSTDKTNATSAAASANNQSGETEKQTNADGNIVEERIDDQGNKIEVVIDSKTGKEIESHKASEGSSSSNNSSNSSANSSKNETVSAIEISYNVSNQWESGGNYFKQYDFTAKNKTGSELKGWEASIAVPAGTSVEQCWNCSCEVKDGKLYINGKGFYSENIGANGNVSGMGAIISSKSSIPINNSNWESNKQTTDNGSTGNASDGNSQNNSQNNNSSSTNKEESNVTEVVTPLPVPNADGTTPLGRHGKLRVSGTKIVDKNGDVFRLCGVSTHGIAWFPNYVSGDTFDYFKSDWGANVIRIAMYVREYNGYLSGGDQAYLMSLIDKGVQNATQLGMYVIIDWHILAFNPNETKSEAMQFFATVSQKYSNYDNVLYEICNEPTGSPWSSVIKPYADDVVSTIRKYDDDAIILVGTNTWSQDVEEVVGNTVNDSNTMYVAHFYAATHGENIRNKIKTAINAGVPVFVSECSICDASGNGGISYEEADNWFNFLKANDISYCAWNISNKGETSALIKSSCSKTSGFSVDDLSDTGKWFRTRILQDTAGY